MQGDGCVRFYIGPVSIRMIELHDELGKFLPFQKEETRVLKKLVEDSKLPLEEVIPGLLHGQTKHYIEIFLQ